MTETRLFPLASGTSDSPNYEDKKYIKSNAVKYQLPTHRQLSMFVCFCCDSMAGERTSGRKSRSIINFPFLFTSRSTPLLYRSATNTARAESLPFTQTNKQTKTQHHTHTS